MAGGQLAAASLELPSDIEQETEARTNKIENGEAVVEARDSEERVSAEVETDSSDPPRRAGPPPDAISSHVGALSDRAIQRLVGGNTFLRGRIYARKQAVDGLHTEGRHASARILVRSADEPYATEIELSEDDKITSRCTCAAWRGPTGHCKHVAAILVSLRDRERARDPERAKNARTAQSKSTSSKSSKTDAAAAKSAGEEGGSRKRRSRRRRRGAQNANGDAGAKIELLQSRKRASKNDARGTLEAWIPEDGVPKPFDFEYRMAVRAASIAVTPVISGSLTAIPVSDALSEFNRISVQDRKLLRLIARHTSRGQPATAELRGEEAAEVLDELRTRKVVLEPASKELRFLDEELKPQLELDQAQDDGVRIRVVFVTESTGRRFSLSGGAWFEGSPGWFVDTTEGVARPLAESVTPGWLQRLYRSPSLVHTVEGLPNLLCDFLPRVSASLGASLPELSSVADLVDAAPRFRFQATGDILEAQAKLIVLYDEHAFDVPAVGMPTPLAVLSEGDTTTKPQVVRRDVGQELAGLQLLLDAGFRPTDNGVELILEGEGAVAFWTDGIASLPDDWEKFIPSDLADVKVRSDAVQPQMRVSSGVDWLSLEMTFDAGGVAVDEQALRECLSRGQRIVRLQDGSYAPVASEDVGEVLSRMAELIATSGGKKKMPLSQAGRIQDLLRLVPEAKVTAGSEQLFKRLDNLDEIEMLTKPRSLKAQLRPYQRVGFSWLGFLHKMGSGGILADDMGLGKTLQTIALILWSQSAAARGGSKSAAKSKSKKKLTLVVAPTSVVPNWQKEIEKFAPSLKTLVWQGPDREKYRDLVASSDVMITSYALIRRDEEFLSELDLNYVILDEAQHIKNPMSATARAAKSLQCDRRLALTGTPIENRLSEIWSIMDFVSPGLLGELKSFEEKYARPIDRGDAEATERLRTMISPLVLRRTKSQVAKDLPEKIQQEIIVPMADRQDTLYKQVLRQVRDSVMREVEAQGVAKSQIQILAALTRLRQVACDPRLMKMDGHAKASGAKSQTEWTADESGKLGALREVISEAVLGKHKVLVFSQFVEMLKLIRNALDEDGVKYEYLDGSTKNRMEKVDEFNEDESISVFLISLKAGGTGLNLTGADTVVHFDPWWNPAVEDQATDRAHRIGQTRVVNVYRLLARGTVEEKILKLSQKKRALVSAVLSSEGTPLKGLTKDEVGELFAE